MCSLLANVLAPYTFSNNANNCFKEGLTYSSNLPSNLAKTFLLNKKSNTSSFLPPQAINVGTNYSI